MQAHKPIKCRLTYDLGGDADPQACRATETLIDVKGLRDRLNMSQPEFAEAFGLSIGTLRRWEQHKRRPHGPARVLLMMISYAPDIAREALKLAAC